MFCHIVDTPLPLKTKVVTGKQAPFMNGPLRKCIYKKRQLRNKYLRNKSNENWEAFRVMRNRCVALKRDSVKNYFLERCAGGAKNTEFWKTVKPFISKKNKSGTADIALLINDKLITSKEDVAMLFNEYYINVAKNIVRDNSRGDIQMDEYTKHPSVTKIQAMQKETPVFNFQEVPEENILKSLKQLNPKKSTGYDGIQPRIVKMSADVIARPISLIINHGIKSNCFPDQLKFADLTPFFKNKEDPLERQNYRPISILPIISKIYESSIAEQLTSFFQNIFSPYLSAFRRGYSVATAAKPYFSDLLKTGN